MAWFAIGQRNAYGKGYWKQYSDPKAIISGTKEQRQDRASYTFIELTEAGDALKMRQLIRLYEQGCLTKHYPWAK